MSCVSHMLASKEGPSRYLYSLCDIRTTIYWPYDLASLSYVRKKQQLLTFAKI